MTSNSTTLTGWDGWRHADIVTIKQAACLLAHCEPLEHANHSLEQLPIEAQNISHVIAYAILAGTLPVFAAFVRTSDGAFNPCPTAAVTPSDTLGDTTTVLTKDLAAWCNARNIPHPWPALGAAQNAAPEHYPSELRDALEAFRAVHGDPDATAKRSPKAALMAWLEENKPGLSINARERIATVANWQPTGGAPKTPGNE